MKPARKKVVRLMIVDDHEVVRAGLAALMGRGSSIKVVAQAGTSAHAVAQAQRLKPDVILMDLRLPDGDGVSACREILAATKATRVVFLTSFPDEEAARAALMAGAAGYLLKDIGHQALVRAVHAVAGGQSILDPRITQPVMAALHARMRPPARRRSDDLSLQESRVVALVVEGKTNREIAAALKLSEKTVKNYLSNAFQKLQVGRRSQAAAVFVRRL